MKTKFILFLLCLFPVLAFTQNQIGGYMYWFNQDFNQRVTQVITPQQQIDLLLSIETENLPFGINTLNFQTFDADGLFSTPVSKFFYKMPIAETGNNQITKYRYWFNDDIANLITIDINPETQVDLVLELDVSSLNLGMNAIHFQTKDNGGNWSSPVSQFFLKNPPSEVGEGEENVITAYRYWFNNDFNNATLNQLSQPTTQHDLILEIDMTSIPKGNYVLNYQSRDTLGLWSSVISQGFTKEPFPIARFNANTYDLCHSGEVSFTNNSFDADVYFWDFGDGNTSTEFEPTHFFDTVGEYLVSLTVTDIPTGNDSTITKTIFVHPIYQYVENAEICEGTNLSWQGNGYSTAGTYYAEYQSEFGCDSTYVLNLIVHPTFEFVENAEICEGNIYTWRGNEYGVTGTYYAEFQTEFGCDSIYVLNLTVKHLPSANVTQNGITLTASESGATYQWINCDDNQPIYGETNQTFTATENGNYAVVITKNGCETTSDCYAVTTIGINQLGLGKMKVYPNPTNGQVFIVNEDYFNNVSINIINLIGQIIYSKDFYNTNLIELTIEGDPGVYFLEINQEYERAFLKIIKE